MNTHDSSCCMGKMHPLGIIDIFSFWLQCWGFFACVCVVVNYLLEGVWWGVVYNGLLLLQNTPEHFSL